MCKLVEVGTVEAKVSELIGKRGRSEFVCSQWYFLGVVMAHVEDNKVLGTGDRNHWCYVLTSTLQQVKPSLSEWAKKIQAKDR